MPEDIDKKKYGFWRLETLPIIPEKFELKPIEDSKDRFTLLKKLLARKDVDQVINACDAGREGELIFAYLYQLAKGKLPVKRAWMQTMTTEGIREAFQRLRDGSQLAGLADAARCRSESDWLIGINGTRALTKRMFGSRAGNVAAVGRVQTPTLAISLRQPRSTPVEKGNQLVAHVVLAMISVIHRFAMNDPPLLLRGCITYGPHLCDRSFLVGPAVDCAAEHMNLPQGAFVWLHPSAANRYRAHIQRIKAEHPDFDPQYVIKDYPMPLKGGEVLQADVVNPLEATPDDPQNLIDAFEEGMNGDSVDIWIKRQHTLAFPRAVLAARGGGSRT
jgi:hypothetical protein